MSEDKVFFLTFNLFMHKCRNYNLVAQRFLFLQVKNISEDYRISRSKPFNWVFLILLLNHKTALRDILIRRI